MLKYLLKVVAFKGIEILISLDSKKHHKIILNLEPLAKFCSLTVFCYTSLMSSLSAAGCEIGLQLGFSKV